MQAEVLFFLKRTRQQKTPHRNLFSATEEPVYFIFINSITETHYLVYILEQRLTVQEKTTEHSWFQYQLLFHALGHWHQKNSPKTKNLVKLTEHGQIKTRSIYSKSTDTVNKIVLLC